MKMRNIIQCLISTITLCLFSQCSSKVDKVELDMTLTTDSLVVEQLQETIDTISYEDISLEKELLYDKHSLNDTYPYKDTTREFQWEKVRTKLALLENIQKKPENWAILRNYKNMNGEAPLVKSYKRDGYKRIADTLGTERFQGIPLFLFTDTIVPEIYGQDGALVRIVVNDSMTRFVQIENIYSPATWMVPRKYIKEINDSIRFKKAIFVDRTNQNIATVEQKADAQWLIRSMNPATTGQHRPPYAQETPTGIFIVQEKKAKMVYLVDGGSETGGFAPYASRFTNGGYIHGVPVNAPRSSIIEYSPSLGTIPRSHMCVRNATSHAKFIYDWAPVNEAIVFVFD